MNPEVINVELVKKEEKDVLVFRLCPEDYPDGISVDLNSEQGQNDLKNIFSALLEEMVKTKITLHLTIEEGYSSNLFVDVCTDYISSLNKEIDQVYESMKEELEI